MDIFPNIVAYHCNVREECRRFILKSQYLICKTEDGIWLGSGMYFWDNASNARYWMTQKLKTPGDYPIVAANINLTKMLDLTDLAICQGIADLWDEYCDAISRGRDAPLGKKLNLLFSTYDNINSSYNVIKIYGKYNYTPANRLYNYSKYSDFCEPTLSIKCIYSVKHYSAILRRSWHA